MVRHATEGCGPRQRNPQHHGFSLRLARAREAPDISGAALSLAVDMHRGSSWGLEAGGRIPRVDTVEKLAKALKVSPCLLAYGTKPSCDLGAGALSAGLPNRLLQVRQERGFSRRELGRLSGTSDNFVQSTETGATVPNIAKVESLAKALKVSPCWLAYGVGDRDVQELRRPPCGGIGTCMTGGRYRVVADSHSLTARGVAARGSPPAGSGRHPGCTYSW